MRISNFSNTQITGNAYDILFDNDLSDLLWRRELAGFKRRERLDVKKPGPPFSTNNYAFKTQSAPSKYLSSPNRIHCLKVAVLFRTLNYFEQCISNRTTNSLNPP